MDTWKKTFDGLIPWFKEWKYSVLSKFRTVRLLKIENRKEVKLTHFFVRSLSNTLQESGNKSTIIIKIVSMTEGWDPKV